MTNENSMHRYTKFIVLASALALSACNDRADVQPEPQPDPAAAPTPDPQAPVSIIRPDVEQPDLPEAQLEPLEISIAFPKGGAELGDEAVGQLRKVLDSQQIKTSANVMVRGHSDSAGTDAANLKASQERAEAVADWLVENGVEGQRVIVIAFGEQNPIEPNALPDGRPNEAGRAANRRVDITIAPQTPTAPAIMDDAPAAN